MKKVEAIIKPFKLEEVRDELLLVGIDGMTVSEVKAFDPHRHTSCYRGAEYVVWFEPQIKLEIVIGDELVADCVGVIAHTACLSESTIAVLPIDRAIRIRTGEPLDEHPVPQPLYRQSHARSPRAALG
jgi:nitrogen regulatory protein P-II 1